MFAILLAAASVGQPANEPEVPPLLAVLRELRHERSLPSRRVVAVRELGRTDCQRSPAAEATLIHALRCDRNECIRYEAASVLARGGCCTPMVTLALSHCVSCSNADGSPSETSGRVRAAAITALEKCLASRCCACELPPLLPPSESPPSHLPPAVSSRDRPGDYYARARSLPREQIAVQAVWSLEVGRQIGSVAPAPVLVSDADRHRMPTSLWELLVGTKSVPSTEYRVAKVEAPVAKVEPVQQAAYTVPSPVYQPVYRSGGVPAEPMAIGRSTLYPAMAANRYR